MNTASQTLALCHAQFPTDPDAESLCIRDCSASQTEGLAERCAVQHGQHMTEVRNVALHQLHVVIASSLLFGLLIIGMLLARRTFRRQPATKGE